MSLHSAIKYFSRKVSVLVYPRLSVFGLVLFIALSVPLLIHKSQNISSEAIFAPETVGLGQGVAACFSGTPTITCNSAGQYVITATIQDPPDSMNVQGFRVIFSTDPNDPEGSVKAEINNISSNGGTYSTTFNGSPGTQYWPTELMYSDGMWRYSDVESPITGPTCPPGGVQGYKVDSDRQAAFAEQTITVHGGNQPPSSGTNPYQIYGLTPDSYHVTSSGPSNHSVSYCLGGGCGYYTLGNNVVVNVTSGSSVDLWWQYSPWTTYCTMDNDTNGNNWQWWKHDAVPDPYTHYEFIRAGDGVCAPTCPAGQTGTYPNCVTPTSGNPPVTATCDANGRGVTLSWSAVAGASAYSPRVQGNQTSCATGWTWWTGDGTGGCYQDNITTTSTYLSGLTPNTTYMTWVHTTVNGVRDNQLNNSTFSCPVTASPDLTVSGITPTSAIAGTATTFSATITNTGAGSTGIGFKNFYQVKTDTVSYTPTNIFAKLFNIAHAAETITDLTYTTMNALAAGGSGVATQVYTFPAAGIYGIRVCADKADRNDAVGVIAESDETNNCGGWTDVNVTAACTPGASCSASNACNYQSGTYNSSCNCSASVPPVPSNFGTSCTSSANVCGQTNSGSVGCNGSCSATTPSDTLCLPTVTLSADPTRVRKDTSTKLTWTSTAATSWTLTGQNGFSSTALSGTNVDSTALDAQTTFTLTCSNTYGSKSASVIVNLIPSYIEQ